MATGLVINTNVASLNGQRNLASSSKALSKSLERLSSGLRINRAGDDAAGLAISENLRSQIRGLGMATRNAQDGISLIQTAEGALETYTEILQRIRELSIQSSSDVNSVDNRASLQLEVEENIDELERIATTINFNGLNLLDGTFLDKRIQIGAQEGQKTDISLGNMRVNEIGSVSNQIGTAVHDFAIQDGELTINGVAIPASESSTAEHKVNAINSVYYSTNVFAKTEPAQTDAGVAVQAIDLAVTEPALIINGYRIPDDDILLPVQANDATGSLRRAINAISDNTGVTATLGPNSELVLTSTDDAEFTYEMAGTTPAPASVSATNIGLVGAVDTEFTVQGRVRLFSDKAYTVATTAEATARGVDSTDLVGIAENSYGVTSNLAVNTVDITSFETAQETVLKIDNALRQINDIRAHLGALTNRLEFTIENLMTSSENLSASDSRIRDADFAVETAALTRAQILQQSGIAVLAQANLTPQGALSLIQG